jgi:hypothetical protein
VSAEFTLDEARAVLSAVRAVAPDGLQLPLSDGDLVTILRSEIEVKDAEQGLLDFPTTIEGVVAYWCWRVGEPDIEWWHPRDAGFAGRQRIVP